MKRINYLILAGVCMVFTGLASAVTTIPVPISEDTPTRMGVAALESSSFAPAALNRLGGLIGLAYGFGGGFEGGFQLHGGAKSTKLFDSNVATSWEVGGNTMIRYLGNITDIFYIGLQGQFGYTYTFAQVNITQGSAITAAVGIPFGLSFGDGQFVVYVMPELTFGGKSANAPEEVFGSLVGVAGAIGTYLYIGGPKIFAEVRPGTKDISSNQNAFVLDALLGIAFDI